MSKMRQVHMVVIGLLALAALVVLLSAPPSPGTAAAPTAVNLKYRVFAPSVGTDSDAADLPSATELVPSGVDGVISAGAVTQSDGRAVFLAPSDRVELRVTVQANGVPLGGARVGAARRGSDIFVAVFDPSGKYLPLIERVQSPQQVSAAAFGPGQVVEFVARLQDAIDALASGKALASIDLTEWRVFAGPNYQEICTTAKQAGSALDLASAGSGIIYSAVTVGGGPLVAAVGLLFGSTTNLFSELAKQSLLSSPDEPVRIRIHTASFPIIGEMVRFVEIDRGACTLPPPVLRRILNPHITSVTSSSMTLAWEFGAGEMEDQIVVSGLGGAPFDIGPNRTSYVVTGLSPNTTYCLSVTSSKAGVSSGSGGIVAAPCATTTPVGTSTPTPPTASSTPTTTLTPGASQTPGSFVATAISQTAIRLTWTYGDDPEGFRFFVGGQLVHSMYGAARSTDIVGLSPGTNYCYTIRAFQGSSQSPSAGPACATTQGTAGLPAP
ncbi:MAG: hypothetical protein C0506_14220, partial [Anaerolinea sp.]|nr:hypothetical protein [Anaerolinea sp.]